LEIETGLLKNLVVWVKTKNRWNEICLIKWWK
jgi:hypothetical protein